MKKTKLTFLFMISAAITIKAQFAMAICNPNYSPLDEHFYACKDSYASIEELKTKVLENCIKGNNGEKPFIFFYKPKNGNRYFAIAKGKSQYGEFAVYSCGDGESEEAAKNYAKSFNRGFNVKIVKVFVPWLNECESD